MKKIDKQEQRTKKTTTNYAPDTHKAFCDRCFKHNRCCPLTGKKTKSETCNV